VGYAGRPAAGGADSGRLVLGGWAHEIAPNLYLGSQEAAKRPLQDFEENKIQAVVNCTRAGHAEEVCFVHEKAGIDYCRVNVLDIETTNILPYLLPVSRWINSLRSSGIGVLVHCSMGRSRSATVAIAALMRETFSEQMNCASLRDQAYIRVKNARPAADPNQGFWQQLQEFEHRLQEGSGPLKAADFDPWTWVDENMAAYSTCGVDAFADATLDADQLAEAVPVAITKLLSRGCDPGYVEWLSSWLRFCSAHPTGSAVHQLLTDTVLNPAWMEDWACEIRTRELQVIVSILNRVGVRPARPQDTVLLEPSDSTSSTAVVNSGADIVRAILQTL